MISLAKRMFMILLKTKLTWFPKARHGKNKYLIILIQSAKSIIATIKMQNDFLLPFKNGNFSNIVIAILDFSYIAPHLVIALPTLQ